MTMIQSRCRIFPQAIPNEYRTDPKRRAELSVYDSLRDGLSSEWTVFYDVPWLSIPEDGMAFDGQADFIVAHKDYGILLIEVKGGGIRYDGPRLQWISRDGNDTDHDIDPFRQVEASKYALLKKLKSTAELASMWIQIFDCVCFPDVMTSGLGVGFDAPADIIIGREHLGEIEKKIRSIFDYLDKSHRHNQDTNRRVETFLLKTLASTTEFPHPFKVETEESEQEIIRLTKEQFRILDLLNRQRRVAVGGGAGSGKTFLAVEKAKRLSKQGFKTLLVCYNRSLAKELGRSCTKEKNLVVSTFHRLCKNAAEKLERRLPNYGAGMVQEEVDSYYAEALSDAMTAQASGKFDAIVVDEGQDFADDWWIALEDCFADKSNGILYAFYDDNQVIYKGRGSVPSDLLVFDLNENVRNSKPIFNTIRCHYTSAAPGDLVCRGPAGRPVESCVYENEKGLQQSLNKVLQRLLNQEQLRESDLVVLTPKNLDERSAIPKLKLPCGISLVRNEEEVGKMKVLCSTINSFKGLERKVAILTELDDEFVGLPESLRKALLYVGLSRPRTHLIVLGTERGLHDAGITSGEIGCHS